MITNIKIHNRFHMEFIKQGHEKVPFDRWHLISIYSKPETQIVRDDGSVPDAMVDQGCVDGLSLEFWDIDPEYEGFDRIKAKYEDMIVFDANHAKSIVSFVKRIHEAEEECVLMAHCSAGVSRSGAVGTFACDYARLDYNEFMIENPFLRANQYVLNMLRREAGMIPSFAEDHDGIDEIEEIDGIYVYKKSGQTVKKSLF